MGQRQEPTRREMVRKGAKLAFAVPIISTFYASQAYAANYSCYGLGHSCTDPTPPNEEPCCAGLSCLGGGPKTCQ